MLELMLTGHWLAAGAVAVTAVLGGWPPGQGKSGRRPRQLVIATDGRLLLDYPEGEMKEAQLLRQSMRLGSHVLLVLAAGGHVHRLLLGPDNLNPGQLAALKCRLPAGSAPPGTALHSPAAPRR
jgi:hypothetical protein